MRSDQRAKGAERYYTRFAACPFLQARTRLLSPLFFYPLFAPSFSYWAKGRRKKKDNQNRNKGKMSRALALPPLVDDDDEDSTNYDNRDDSGGKNDGGSTCMDYPTCFRALVRAIADDDADGVRRALGNDGGVGANDLFGQSATLVALRAATATPYYGVPRRLSQPVALAATPYAFGGGGDEDTGDRDPGAPNRDALAPASEPPRVQARLTRPAPTTPLGLAAAHGSINAARALIEAGAVPWPTPEAVLNEALATMNVGAFARPTRQMEPYDAADMVALLLATFGRSNVLSAWDVNPLSVVLGLASADARIAAAADVPLASLRLSRMLLDAGYSPDERARGVVLLQGHRQSPEHYQRERAKVARLTTGRELLERIEGIEERYPSLTDPDAAQDDEDEPVPPYAPLYRDALWALTDEYSAVPAGQQTARDLYEFTEWGYVPFQ
ncbi:hypothetical protein pqer_cds_423 [Pandoravirus quercus]|uniref:Uncharacterized protein n=2 Tax=Pandoravirus TaxID=2060084 RepID=A0A2U7U8Y1_9VIRU|nr:hypothetical protein pqer_cds_423 [Pandoravirus quercus]AVK74845.1 hypothetical protein pqer_cds_423 [Pandoravirus quercus]QBZ81030.1 hypothetical protein pclt_cds_434 [Pandoravirus celtis]